MQVCVMRCMRNLVTYEVSLLSSSLLQHHVSRNTVINKGQKYISFLSSNPDPNL